MDRAQESIVVAALARFLSHVLVLIWPPLLLRSTPMLCYYIYSIFFNLQLFLIKIYDILKNNILTCSCWDSIESWLLWRYSSRLSLLYSGFRYSIAVYLSGARVSIFSTLVPRLLWSAQAFHSQVDSRDIIQQGSKGEQPFLNVTHWLDLVYMYTKYYQNISKDKRVIEPTSFPL